MRSLTSLTLFAALSFPSLALAQEALPALPSTPPPPVTEPGSAGLAPLPPPARRAPPPPPPVSDAPPASADASVSPAAAAAREEDAVYMGRAGTAAISSDMSLSLQYASRSTEGGAGGDSTTTILLAPAFDFFVADGVSIGGGVSFGSTTQSPASGASKTISTFGLGARVGYYATFDRSWGFWPRAGLGYGIATSDNVTANVADFELYAPFVLQPAQHFFAGLGPNLDVQLSSSTSSGSSSRDLPKETRVGLAFLVGGWW